MSKIEVLRQALRDILAQHQADGTLPTSARFLYYELVAVNVVSKHATGARRADQGVIDALKSLRDRREIPWDWIVDETRSLEDHTGFPSIAIGVDAYLNTIRIDPWSGAAPLILTESRSLAGALRNLAREYAVKITATNGQVGGFLHTDVAPALGDEARVLYLGDFDLAGADIEANTSRSRLGASGADAGAGSPLQPAGHHQVRWAVREWRNARRGRDGGAVTVADRPDRARPARRAAASAPRRFRRRRSHGARAPAGIARRRGLTRMARISSVLANADRRKAADWDQGTCQAALNANSNET
jgi:hypothetical protein